MNYYYDIILNWNDLRAYEFYEWNDTDYLELIKKIPLFKIKHKSFVDILTHNIKLNKDVMDIIQDKTLLSGKNLVSKIPYACLVTDGKNVLALEFREDGTSINRSKLLLDDEINILEVTYNLKEYNFMYEVQEEIEMNKMLRQEMEAKHLIMLEINNLYQNKDDAKLRYLYYEYKKEKIDDVEVIYRNLVNDIDNSFNKEILKLYYIIKLSYHKV